jgi:CRP/FNR family transcriptional regulator
MHTVRAEELFCGLSAKTLQEFETIKCTRAYHKGALLFVEGQTPRGIFALCSGRVRLSGSTTDGKRLILKIAGPGDILGLSATVAGQPYQVSAQAMELCQVSFVSGEDLVCFAKKHCDFCFRVAKQLAEKYRAGWLGLSLLGQPVNKRLANLLLEWKPQNGWSFKQELRIDLPLSHEEIAERIGVTRETVSRAFSDLKKQGILRGRRSTWVICNESALKAIAGNY